MKLVKVKRVHEPIWHYALETDVRPVCACGCKSPAVPRNRGDATCKCVCHRQGFAKAKALCEMGLTPRGAGAVQPALFDEVGAAGTGRGPWKEVEGRGNACQACVRLGVLVNKDVVDWHLREVGT